MQFTITIIAAFAAFACASPISQPQDIPSTGDASGVVPVANGIPVANQGGQSGDTSSTATCGNAQTMACCSGNEAGGDFLDGTLAGVLQCSPLNVPINIIGANGIVNSQNACQAQIACCGSDPKSGLINAGLPCNKIL